MSIIRKNWFRLGLLLFTVLSFVLLIGGNAAGQEVDAVIEIIPDETEAATRIEDALVSTETGAPLNLYQVNYAVTPGTPEAMADQYLSENADQLHLRSVSLADINHRMTREGLAGATVRYTQSVDAVPVYKAEIVVHINNDSLVTYVINDYKSDLKAVDTNPTLSAEQAQRVAYEYLNVQRPFNFEATQLFIYPGKSTRLAYQVRVMPAAPMGDWEVLVDAHSGEIIKAVDIAFKQDDADAELTLVDGNGNVFDPDPLTSGTATYGDTGYTDNGDATSAQLTAQTFNVTLPDLTFSGGQYQLKGPYAQIVDTESPFNGLYSQAGSSFNFNRNQDGFEAVNTYYHIDASMRYINETLGITLMPYQYAGGVKFDPHGLSGADNSHYTSGNGVVAFGEGGVDDAEDSDVVHHELGHGLHDWLTGGSLSQVNGLSEGSGDYWAQSYNRSIDSWTPSDPAYHYVFRWDGHNEFWNGRVTNYSAVYPGGLTGSIHTDGQIWSTCLMKIWDDIGKSQTDKIFLEGLAMTNSSTSQDGAANAAYQAAIDMGYSTAELQSIHSNFSSCGYTLPDLPSLKISKSANPSPVEAGSTLEYTLEVTNNTASAITAVTISDNVPADTTYVNGSATCGGSETAGVVSFPLGTMNGSDSVTCTFKVLVNGGLGGSTTFFTDDMESGSGNWTTSTGSGSSSWALGTNNPHNGSFAWFANDVGSVTDQYLTMSNPVALGSSAVLTIWHHYDTESTYDGGVVEISANGGSWTDLGSLMMQNKYNSTISSNYNSPISGREAFSGNSGGYIETLVDLSSYAGDNVVIRFRMATDSSISANGWFVDDVTLATQGASITNTACVNSAQGHNDCDTVMTPVEAAICVTPTAVSDLSATLNANGADVDLAWSDAGADYYDIHHKSNDFYFAPAGGTFIASINGTAFTDSAPNIIGDVSNNYSYVLLAVNDCAFPPGEQRGFGVFSGPSNRVGEFDFEIIPGMVSH
ncbi:MAG: immune inhibitor A [Anaerolineales bacterium]|nr:immune inhibitor A [Anaerolineales bacterium]